MFAYAPKMKGNIVVPSIFSGVAVVIALGAIALAIGLHLTQNGTTSTLDLRTTSLQTQLNTSIMQTQMLQSQLVELMMDAANITILQQGTFIWALSDINGNPPANGCFSSVVPGYVLVTAGTNYRVGDLITGKNTDAVGSYNYQEHLVLRVDTVGLLGEVTSFTVLTPGCFISGAGNTTIETRSAVGSGVTLKRYAGPYSGPVEDVYYTYPTPPSKLVSPLQRGNYTIKELTIHSVPFIIAEISPPEFPMAASFDYNPYPIGGLRLTMYQFDPPSDVVQTVANYDYIFPLTQRNYNAISLVDDSPCFNVQPDVCWLSAYPYVSAKLYPSAVGFEHANHGTNSQFDYPYIFSSFNSANHVHQYVAENAVFTLNYPLMLVLPSF